MPNQGPGSQPPPADQAQELLAMVAHELRRPLTAVRGALATVRHRGHALPASQQQELLGIAHRQAEQMQRLVDQLLVAAALERPRPSPPDGRWSTPALWPRRPPGPPGWPIPASRSPSRLLGRCWSPLTPRPSAASWETCSTMPPATLHQRR